MKGHCFKSLKMLMSRGLDDLHDNGFEGSVNEDHIFREVFGNESGRSSKRYDVTRAINFGDDNAMPKNTSFCSESDNSVMTIQEDFQNRKEDYGGISEEFALFTRNAPDVEVKRMKVSPGEHSDSTISYLEKVVKSSNPSKEVDSCLYQQAALVTGLVEPSEHVGDVGDKDLLGCRLSNSNTNDEKINEGKISVTKKRWKDSSFVEINEDEYLVPPTDTTTSPKPLLRYHTYCLLRAAGWAIGKRKRIYQNNGRGEFMYKTPEGRPIREFHRAWHMCGQRLVEDAKFVGACDDIWWTDFTQFQSDLSNVYTEVNELSNSESATALARWWYLLDPYAKSVFIDKSWTSLKQGKEVKAKRSVVYHSGSSKSPVKWDKFNKSDREKKGKSKLKDDDLLLSAVPKNENIYKRTYNKQSYMKKNSHVPKIVRKYKTKKGGCRLLLRSGKVSKLGARTVLSWLIDHRVIHHKESVQYRNPQDNSVVKRGQVGRKGILCQCCKKMLSLSEFKNHAGFNMNRPCLNLFMKSGKSFILCQLEAWSTEYKVRRNAKRGPHVNWLDSSDDSCGLCGDGGDLICCDNCLSTFHQLCLSTEELPEGNWYCSKCCCSSCGDVVSNKESSVSNTLKCLQCEHKYHKECIKEMGIRKKFAGPAWFCGETCEKIHSDLDSRIGCVNPISDGFSWTLLKCIHGDPKVHSAPNFVALKAECNLKLAIALSIMEECFLPMMDTRTGIHMIPHVLYNWGSEYVRLNYEGFYTVVLEKDDVLLCVASLRIHGTTVAEMPLIATCSRHRRQGMCRRLVNAIEEMLKSFNVEKLVVSAIPNLVETWIEGFGFSPMEADEKKSLHKTNLMVFPGTVWLKKNMNQGSTQSMDFLGEPHLSGSTSYRDGDTDGSGTTIEDVASDQLEMVPVDCNKFLQECGIRDGDLVEVAVIDETTSNKEAILGGMVSDVLPTVNKEKEFLLA